MSTVKKSIVYAIITIILGIYVFFDATNLNPLYLDGALLYCAAITIYTLAYLIMRNRLLTKLFASDPEPDDQDSDNVPAPQMIPEKKFPRLCKLLLVLPWAVFFALLLIFSPLFNWKTYRDQLTTPTVKSFSTDVQQVDISKVPVVDYNLAMNLAEKQLGKELSLSSQVYLGSPVLQQVKGELMWVVPLHHSGFFKWLTNSAGTAGYITVSATNAENVKLVTNYKIKYHPDSYFMDDLYRHIRFSNSLFKGISNISFEIDDSGKPYWIVSTYKNIQGFTLPEVDGIIIVDATTGKTQKYALDQLPSWVDRVQPQNYILSQINNRGQYVHGFFNVANKEKYKVSTGDMIIYNNNRCYLFAGLTGVGSEESTIGFILVDLITKDTTQYNIGGTTEKVAQSTAEGKVQSLKYKASYPYIINVDGNPTYFMTLKDNSNIIKQFALVSVANFQTVGNGETIESALRNYKQALENSPSNPTPAPTGKLVTIESTVTRIAYESQSDIITYKFILQRPSDIIFLADSSLSAELILTQPGDKVKITYLDNGDGIITVSYFDNVTFNQRVSSSTAWT